MTDKLKNILEEYGFKSYSGDEINYKHQSYFYDTKMVVQGSHADDYAYIIYLDEDDIKGFCYASSLMEYLMTYFDNHNIESMLKDINKHLSTNLELYDGGYLPLIINKCKEEFLDKKSVNSRMSNMLKLVGILDYLLPKRLDYLRKQN